MRVKISIMSLHIIIGEFLCEENENGIVELQTLTSIIHPI